MIKYPIPRNWNMSLVNPLLWQLCIPFLIGLLNNTPVFPEFLFHSRTSGTRSQLQIKCMNNSISFIGCLAVWIEKVMQTHHFYLLLTVWNISANLVYGEGPQVFPVCPQWCIYLSFEQALTPCAWPLSRKLQECCKCPWEYACPEVNVDVITH